MYINSWCAYCLAQYPVGRMLFCCPLPNVNDIAQTVYDAALGDTLLDNDENGVVASYRAEYIGYVAVVDVVGYRACIAGPGLDDSHVAGEIYRHKSRHLHHFCCREWLVYTFVHSLIGQHVYIFAVHACRLGNLQLLEVTA